MILITGATGNFGQATLSSLLKKGIPPNEILAFVRNEASTKEFKELGIGTVQGDYDDYTSLTKAFAGVDKLLFISGNDIANRLQQHINIINAAKEAGVKHIVYTSFQRKNETASSPLWAVAHSHLETEKALKESGLTYTILKNNLYMDFLPGFIGENVLESQTIFVPAEQGKISAVLRSEMAEAAANILSSNGHENKEYDFTNTEAISYNEIATLISKATGKNIQYVSPSPEVYEKTLSSYGVPAEVVGIFTSFAVGQAQGELDKVSTDLENILQRKPISVQNFIEKTYASRV
ncbi:NAD(P)-dependent oxidoreductase [Flavobacterium sp. 9AF]|uniref:SDR family oxidoreductase n=1 Tax=Flavobacterium sp. 9AF TaxID=2653142 RepID=UPI0012F42B1C|nr:SDR family oxidoreductase [Flavobacterium sp. 9AF]VXB90574.1 NAD(P)-dependent oxidoreductase [Flavobacterium sp. 9AF]